MVGPPRDGVGLLSFPAPFHRGAGATINPATAGPVARVSPRKSRARFRVGISGVYGRLALHAGRADSCVGILGPYGGLACAFLCGAWGVCGGLATAVGAPAEAYRERGLRC